MEEQSISIRLVRSRRKSVTIQVTNKLEVVVRAPYQMTDREIEQFVEQNEQWIRTHLARMEQDLQWESQIPRLTEAQLDALMEEARRVIPKKVARYADEIGVTYGRVTIRHQKTRWGSCGANGNLNFNCLLMQMPDAVVDYVVVHELCHRKEMNHSDRFWKEVEKILPDYQEQRRWLREHGKEIIMQLGR